MPRFEGIADDAECALEKWCERGTAAQPGPNICALCARLDRNVLAQRVHSVIHKSGVPQPSNPNIDSITTTHRDLLKQVVIIMARRKIATQAAMNSEPKTYVCVTQDIDEEGKEWKLRYRPRSTVCETGPWNGQGRGNLCPKCLPGVKESCAEFFSTTWNEEGIMWTNAQESHPQPPTDEEIEAMMDEFGRGERG